MLVLRNLTRFSLRWRAITRDDNIIYYNIIIWCTLYNIISYTGTEQMFADFVTPAGPWLIDGQIGPEKSRRRPSGGCRGGGGGGSWGGGGGGVFVKSIKPHWHRTRVHVYNINTYTVVGSSRVWAVIATAGAASSTRNALRHDNLVGTRRVDTV